MSGMRFGRLTVMKVDGKNNRGRPLWLCKCDCGNETHVERQHLIRGQTKSCGCFRKEFAKRQHTTHGLSKSINRQNRLYRIWSGIKDRCCNTNSKYWNRYGGRGIKICEEWKNNYLSFHAWALSNGYLDELTLDRINNDGNYEPSNCRWATWETQENNRSDNIIFNIEGEKISLAQLARKENTTRFIAEKKHKGDIVNGKCSSKNRNEENGNCKFSFAGCSKSKR